MSEAIIHPILLGKIVKVSKKHWLPFFYPGFEVCENLSLIHKGKSIIYAGPLFPDLLLRLRLLSSSFICTVGRPEIDLSSTEQLLEYVYSKHGKAVPAYVVESSSLLGEQELEYCMKIVWVTGVWPYRPKEGSPSIFYFYKSLLDPITISLRTFLEIVDSYPSPIVESALLTFISRSQTIEDQSVSPNYRLLLTRFKDHFKTKLKPALVGYAVKIHERDRIFGMLDFLISLR